MAKLLADSQNRRQIFFDTEISGGFVTIGKYFGGS